MFAHRHLLGIEGLSRADIEAILDLADAYVALNRQTDKRADALRGLTQINMFFEASTRTQASFELAGKRLGANVMNMSVAASSVKKGETLIDTAMTLNAMHPDLLVVRHPSSGAVNLLASKVNCAVLNAGDGRHEHPTQALLDALTIRRRKGRLSRLTVAICGDIAHSRVARSNIILLGRMENRIRLIAPPTLIPPGADRMGVEIFQDMAAGLEGADVVMMLRLQRERMDGALIPSMREYYHRFGLDAEKLAAAKPDAIVMHPGPMNRGVEIDGLLADDINVSVIQEQVEMGVAVRMAAMDLLAETWRPECSVRGVGYGFVTGIAAATEALKLTNELRSIERELDKAELKLRLVELTDRLLEAKEALQDAKEERRDLEQRVSELEGKLRQQRSSFDERGRFTN